MLPGPCHLPPCSELWVAVVNASPSLLSGPALPGFGRKGWGNIEKLSPAALGMWGCVEGRDFLYKWFTLRAQIKLKLGDDSFLFLFHVVLWKNNFPQLLPLFCHGLPRASPSFGKRVLRKGTLLPVRLELPPFLQFATLAQFWESCAGTHLHPGIAD